MQMVFDQYLEGENTPDVHFPLSAISIFFSTGSPAVTLTPEEEIIIDRFFDGLRFDNLARAKKIDAINLNELLNFVDFEKRWVYKGSLTTPPCTSMVYWNVLSTVYPIKASHVTAFKNYLNLIGAQDYTGSEILGEIGNTRKINEVTPEHDVMYVQYMDQGTSW